jgi:hypothetical protein
MNKLIIQRRVPGAFICVTVLLLAGILAGCAEQKAPKTGSAARTPASDQSAADKTPAAITDAATPDQRPAAADTSKATTDSDTVTVGSCDGENTVTVAKEATGQGLADALMDQWLRDHPEANWVAEEKEKHTLQPPADNSGLLQGDQGKGHTYGNYTEKDILTWARETEKFVVEGSRIFHSGDLLGSSVGVSCDMCHPHAANTHPETYPKFQVQLGRVVLLRDMIDWCVENPVRGEHLDPNGPTMRALEAYIMAQRKGVAMEYGKH